MKSINKDMQDYFIKLVPDFSVLDMAEMFIYDNDLTPGVFNEVFCYYIDSGLSLATTFHRGMFIVYTNDGDISIHNIYGEEVADDEYTVFPYKSDSQIVIAIQPTPIIIKSTKNINLVIGVAF